jgi:hypothetical protein
MVQLTIHYRKFYHRHAYTIKKIQKVLVGKGNDLVYNKSLLIVSELTATEYERTE